MTGKRRNAAKSRLPRNGEADEDWGREGGRDDDDGRTAQSCEEVTAVSCVETRSQGFAFSSPCALSLDFTPPGSNTTLRKGSKVVVIGPEERGHVPCLVLSTAALLHLSRHILEPASCEELLQLLGPAPMEPALTRMELLEQENASLKERQQQLVTQQQQQQWHAAQQQQAGSSSGQGFLYRSELAYNSNFQGYPWPQYPPAGYQ